MVTWAGRWPAQQDTQRSRRNGASHFYMIPLERWNAGTEGKFCGKRGHAPAYPRSLLDHWHTEEILRATDLERDGKTRNS